MNNLVHKLRYKILRAVGIIRTRCLLKISNIQYYNYKIVGTPYIYVRGGQDCIWRQTSDEQRANGKPVWIQYPMRVLSRRRFNHHR